MSVTSEPPSPKARSFILNKSQKKLMALLAEGCCGRSHANSRNVLSSTTVIQDRESKPENRLGRLELVEVLISSESRLGITVLQNNDEVLVRLNGHITVDSSPDLRERLLEVLSEEPAPRVVTVDLTGLSYVEASGIATLIEGLKIARRRRTTFCLQGLGGSVLRLFEVTGVLALFEARDCGQKVS
jgi:anti-sigma B factor antagonist